MPCIGTGLRCVGRDPAGPWFLWSLGLVGFLPDLHGFFHWVMTSMHDLNRFVKQVVVTRRDSKLLQWGNWLREDMGSRPYAWLRPDLFPLPLSWWSRILSRGLLVFWLSLISLMLSSGRLGCPSSAGRVIQLLR